MCLIGLLLPFKHNKSQPKHKSRRSSHRRSERPHRERSHRREKDEPKDSRAVAEDALARLCLSIQQSLLEEQQRWRGQGQLDMLEAQRLGLEREHAPPPEEAPPYSVTDDSARRPSPEPQYQTGVADSPQCRRRDSGMVGSASANCCRTCVCTRCGSPNIKCPPISELDDTRVRASEGHAEPRRRRASRA